MRLRYLIATSLLCLIVLSTAMTIPAYAASWVGWDNGEFDVQSGTLQNVWIQESLSQQMAWSSSPPNNLVSLQYNPDDVYSYLFQYYSDVFQTGIVSTQGSCAQFVVEVYFWAWPYNPVYHQYYPGPNTCTYVSGIFGSGAVWYVQEAINSGQKIWSVSYFLSGFNGANLYATLYVPTTWQWLRSNAVWVGTDGGKTTFTSGAGTAYAGSNLNVVSVSPPSVPATGEDSNMGYGCFQGSGTHTMWQSFGLGGHC